MLEAARTSETSVDIQLRTPQNIPEDSELHTPRRENLKSLNQQPALHVREVGWFVTAKFCGVLIRSLKVSDSNPNRQNRIS
jgi:hypothetical protein